MAETKAQIVAVGSEGKGIARGDSLEGSASGLALHGMDDHPAWPMISRLPVMLAVNIPLCGFKVCELLELRCGQTIQSVWSTTEDVPLKVGALQIGCGEFEVVEQRLALRLTRLA